MNKINLVEAIANFIKCDPIDITQNIYNYMTLYTMREYIILTEEHFKDHREITEALGCRIWPRIWLIRYTNAFTVTPPHHSRQFKLNVDDALVESELQTKAVLKSIALKLQADEAQLKLLRAPKEQSDGDLADSGFKLRDAQQENTRLRCYNTRTRPNSECATP